MFNYKIGALLLLPVSFGVTKKWSKDHVHSTVSKRSYIVTIEKWPRICSVNRCLYVLECSELLNVVSYMPFLRIHLSSWVYWDKQCSFIMNTGQTSICSFDNISHCKVCLDCLPQLNKFYSLLFLGLGLLCPDLSLEPICFICTYIPPTVHMFF